MNSLKQILPQRLEQSFGGGSHSVDPLHSCNSSTMPWSLAVSAGQTEEGCKGYWVMPTSLFPGVTEFIFPPEFFIS